MKVLGHELPPLLERIMQGGRALGPEQLAAINPLLTRVDDVRPKLYNPAYIIETNRLWESESAKFYLGTASNVYLPGDIDPRRVVIIGEAEPDSPIALDYRITPPRVVYLGDVEHESYWIELAQSYDALVAKLHLDVHRE